MLNQRHETVNLNRQLPSSYKFDLSDSQSVSQSRHVIISMIAIALYSQSVYTICISEIGPENFYTIKSSSLRTLIQLQPIFPYYHQRQPRQRIWKTSWSWKYFLHISQIFTKNIYIIKYRRKPIKYNQKGENIYKRTT